MALAAVTPAGSFDPWAAAGFAPAPAPTNDNGTAPGMSATIDVGGPSYSPDIPAGQQGSEVAPSLTTPAGGAGAAPSFEATVTAHAPAAAERTDPVALRILNDLASGPPQRTPSATPAAITAPGASQQGAAFDPWQAAGFAPAPEVVAPTAQPTAAQPVAAAAVAPAPTVPIEGHPVTKTLGGPYPAVGTPEFSALPWYDRLKASLIDAFFDPNNTRLGAQQSVSHGATLGFDEDAVPAIAAGIDSLAKGVPFTQAYDQSRKEMKANRQAFETANPTAGGILETAGALATAPAAGPLFGAVGEGAGLLARGATAVRNVAAGTGLGAAAGFGQTEGDLAQRTAGAVQGAETGGAVSAAAPVIGRTVGTIAKAITPTAQTDRLAAGVLRENGLAPGVTIALAPVAGVPLNLAQATGSPEVASLVDTRNAANVPAMKREVTAQNQGLLGAIEGRNPSEPGLSTGRAAGPASAAATGAVQQAAGIIGREESRLWNTPAMSRPIITTNAVRGTVARGAADVIRSDPGLGAAIQQSGSIKAALKILDLMPQKVAAKDLNAVASALRRIQRDPRELGADRVAAGRLAQVVQDAIWSAPEVAGTPARLIPQQMAEWHEAGGVVPAGAGTPRVAPGIKPDPDLVRDLTAARAFTKREAQVLGHASFDNILRRNSQGNETVTPGTAMAPFYDFANGVERPGAITNVMKFLDDIGSEWRRLGIAKAGGDFDPVALENVRNELGQGARDYITAKMLDRVFGVARDMTGERNIQAGQIANWIEKNRGMITRTGLFSPAQLDLWDRLRQTGMMIHRGYELGRAVGSPTYTRLMHPTRYLDLFVSPATRAVVGTAAGALVGSSLGTLGEVGIGALLGIGAERVGPALMHKLYQTPRSVLIQKIDQAIRDPAIAGDLMRRMDGRGPISDRTKAWARSFLAIEPSEEAARGPGGAQ